MTTCVCVCVCTPPPPPTHTHPLHTHLRTAPVRSTTGCSSGCSRAAAPSRCPAGASGRRSSASPWSGPGGCWGVHSGPRLEGGRGGGYDLLTYSLICDYCVSINVQDENTVTWGGIKVFCYLRLCIWILLNIHLFQNKKYTKNPQEHVSALHTTTTTTEAKVGFKVYLLNLNQLH